MGEHVDRSGVSGALMGMWYRIGEDNGRVTAATDPHFLDDPARLRRCGRS